MVVQMEWLLTALIGLLWPLAAFGLGFMFKRLIRAIDQLTETVTGHALDLVEIKTTLGIRKGS